MRRRDFIGGVAGISSAWPFDEARSAPSSKVPIIGYLGAATLSVTSEWVAAFVQRLRELGWIDGHTVAIEYRWAEGRSESYAAIAVEFMRLNVDVIFTSGTPAVLASKRATSVIPIVFAAAGDPVGNGLVASLARPGGNITGLSLMNPDLASKQVELLREVIPDLHRLAILFNVANPIAAQIIREVQAAARTIGLQVATLEIKRANDIGFAFEKFKGPAAALYVLNDPLINTHRVRINTLALAARLPTIYPQRDTLKQEL